LQEGAVSQTDLSKLVKEWELTPVKHKNYRLKRSLGPDSEVGEKGKKKGGAGGRREQQRKSASAAS